LLPPQLKPAPPRAGTMAILAAIYAAGVRRGDESICPSMTFWASCAQALQLGAVRAHPPVTVTRNG